MRSFLIGGYIEKIIKTNLNVIFLNDLCSKVLATIIRASPL